MAVHPWINPYSKAPLDLTPFANVRRWHAAIAERPAVQRAYALAQQYGANREMTPEMRKILFGTPSPTA
jgi:GST-like protein